MKRPLHALWSVLLALALAVSPLTGTLHSAQASGANYDQQYELAIGLLRDLLNADNLREAAKLFRELGSQSLARYYAYYTDVVLSLLEDDAAAMIEGLDTLDLLEMNEAFTANLAERKLPGCADLRQYGQARQLELNQRYTEAKAIFASLSILDAIDRAIRLNPLAREEQRQAAEEAARQEAERKAAEEAARQEAERQAAEEAERKAIVEALWAETLRRIAPGDHLLFGRYEQDNDLSNGSEAIEWLVLNVVDDRALLLSRYGLDVQPYHNQYEKITWEHCSLRQWLNGDFLRRAFTAQEQAAILTTAVDNSEGDWDTYGENMTMDQIFLLSSAEAHIELGASQNDIWNVKSRMSPTAYAVKHGAYATDHAQTADGLASGRWWLRSPGRTETNAAVITGNGALTNYSILLDDVCVRPALWIDLTSGRF